MNIRKYIKNNSIIKTGATYSFWATLKSLSTTAVGIAVMLWLTPLELGKWNTVSIFLAYAPFLQLGIQSGLNIELPVKLGGGKQDDAETLIANGYGYAIIISIIIGIIGLITAIVYGISGNIDILAGILTITLVAICSSFQLHFIARFRSAKAFDALSTIFKIEIPFILLCTIFVYLYHYWGILLYNIIINLFNVVLMLKYAPFKHIKPCIKKLTIMHMGKIGIALMVLVQLRTAAQTLPRWIIIFRGGVEKLGLFTPATAIQSLICLIPSQVAQFFHPQMGYLYGKTGLAKSMWNPVKKMVVLLPIVSLPIAVFIWILSPWLLDTFFPNYVEALWPMRIMAIAFIFTSSATTSWILNTLKAFRYSYIYAIIDFAGCFVYPLIMTYILPYNVLTSVTIGLAINSIISYIINILILRHVLHMSKYN
ncbi:hypothetical protein CE91St19_21840 [Odoribacter laneus]|uniref:Polysaccharide biosynthesis protein C-terminal domain-containing protein n=2 Tax=Odoribacter laneus TaxID=626933 RepID=H1DCP5_9BACT|nr:hypothetical protein [Odoribacter laneus]EHP51100.1 hypothetical protein HMPREF9449_00102 [Odoribacter laneus YIT 12061]GKI22782.1 hypothetical protein CE91St19_21840 [Odoribacter laneus]GKI25225.1 hypothetical protein CE91St20_13620 [Odoribacter laneus]